MGCGYVQVKGGPPTTPNPGATSTPGDTPAPPNALGRRLLQDFIGKVSVKTDLHMQAAVYICKAADIGMDEGAE